VPPESNSRPRINYLVSVVNDDVKSEGQIASKPGGVVDILQVLERFPKI
jgi:hypothetical protein